MTSLQRLGRLLFTTLLALIVGFALWLVVFTGSIVRDEPTSVGAADAIIVLTGGADRIQDGLLLLEAQKGRRLLISGVHRIVTLDEMRKRWPGHDHAFGCCVDLDFRALNTFENARESAVWMQRHGFGSAVLVTASYHMPRALLEFQTVLPGARIVPAPVIPDPKRLEHWWLDATLARIITLESIKYAAARIRIAVISFFG
jgi:uncharacterized SAM-binding protein YcdF (DUF218 family)